MQKILWKTHSSLSQKRLPTQIDASGRDLQDTLRANRDRCVGMAADDGVKKNISSDWTDGFGDAESRESRDHMNGRGCLSQQAQKDDIKRLK